LVGLAFFPKSPRHLPLLKIRCAGGGTNRLSKKLMSERRDPFAIVLLLCVTVSYACQLPGVPRDMVFGSVPTVIPQDTIGWIEFAAIWFLVLIPGFAAAYSFIRPNFLRVPLIAAGFLVLLLWLLAAPLRAALEAAS